MRLITLRWSRLTTSHGIDQPKNTKGHPKTVALLCRCPRSRKMIAVLSYVGTFNPHRSTSPAAAVADDDRSSPDTPRFFEAASPATWPCESPPAAPGRFPRAPGSVSQFRVPCPQPGPMKAAVVISQSENRRLVSQGRKAGDSRPEDRRKQGFSAYSSQVALPIDVAARNYSLQTPASSLALMKYIPREELAHSPQSFPLLRAPAPPRENPAALHPQLSAGRNRYYFL